MQINGFPSYYFPRWATLQSRVTADEAAAAKTQLTTPGSNPANPSDILTQSFNFESRKVPTTDVSTPLAAFRVLDAVRYLADRISTNGPTLTEHMDRSNSFRNTQKDILGAVRSSLQALRSEVQNLRRPEALNTRTAESFRPDEVGARAGESSPVTTVSVKPLKLATNHTMVSDTQTTPFVPVGIAGSFVINGFKVEVAATDTIVDIQNKINRGEDGNSNGELDLDEDINGNGTLDTLVTRASRNGPSLFIKEDRNGNGEIDSGEDANDNGFLDGGTAQTGILASIEDNRLKIENLTGAKGNIDLTDTNGILLALGFFELNHKNQPVIKEIQWDSGENLNKSAEDAELAADDTQYNSPTNNFTEVVPDAILTVRRESDRTTDISIKYEPDSAIARIRSFFGAFNNAMTSINAALEGSTVFTSDPDLQRLRDDLADSSRGDIPAIVKRNDAIDSLRGPQENLRQFGVAPQNTEKNVVSEISVTREIQSLKNGLQLPFKNAAGDLLKRLSSVGIRGLEDDTFAVDPDTLRRALDTNAKEVKNTLNDAAEGITPKLETALNSFLAPGIGAIDVKALRLDARAGLPPSAGPAFRNYIDSSTEQTRLKNILAVV